MSIAVPSINIDAIPAELRSLPQWVLWRTEVRNNKPTKVPYSHRRQPAKANDPKTWATFDEAVQAYRRWEPASVPKLRFDGIGFVFSKSDPFCGVDLDKSRDPDTGDLQPWAAQIVESLASYAEVSPSNTGLKIWVRARKTTSSCKVYVDADGNVVKEKGSVGAIEVYDHNRYFTVTGRLLADMPNEINERQVELVRLCNRFFPAKERSVQLNGHHKMAVLAEDDVLRIASAASNGLKFQSLWSGEVNAYGSHSEADLALCNMLAFYAGGDAQKIDALFRQSGLFREKWEREDYRSETILKAIESCGGTFYGSKSGRLIVSARENDSETQFRFFKCTDMGNAERLIHQHGTKLRYCHPWKKWLHFDGKRWRTDAEGSAVICAKRTVRNIYREAAEIEDAEVRDEVLEWAKRSESSQRIASMLKLAEPELSVLPADLDRDPWLLNVENGILDMKTGKLRPHDPTDLITKLCPHPLIEDATCPLWESSLQTIFNEGDEGEIIPFAQRFVGMALTGDVREQILAILWGGGSNGKSVFVETCLHVLGADYAGKAPRDFLTVTKSDRHPTEIADLFGKRLVIATETDQGKRLSEGLVKELTGGDKLTARRMKEDFWSFEPTHKLALVTNHKPAVRGGDHGIWRRLVLIPFTQRFWNPDKAETGPEHLRQDKQLLDKLKAEAPGILAWAVRGCLDWQTNGLQIPDIVRQATDEYRSGEDIFTTFLDERCVTLPGTTARASDLYATYRDYVEQIGEHPMRQVEFGKMLAERGFTNYRGTGGVRWWRGIGIQADTNDEGVVT